VYIYLGVLSIVDGDTLAPVSRAPEWGIWLAVERTEDRGEDIGVVILRATSVGASI
jgi:hypothetical protein